MAMAVFCWLMFFDFFFVRGVISGGQVTTQIQFMVVFVNLTGGVLIALPWLTKKAEGISNESIKEFFCLPEKHEKIRFTDVSGFLSDQALASFLATVLIFTGKGALEEYGGAVAALYVGFLFVVSLILASVSLLRFIAKFTRYNWFSYALGAALSTGVMFAFFNVGLRLAG